MSKVYYIPVDVGADKKVTKTYPEKKLEGGRLCSKLELDQYYEKSVMRGECEMHRETPKTGYDHIFAACRMSRGQHHATAGDEAMTLFQQVLKGKGAKVKPEHEPAGASSARRFYK